MQRTSSWSWTRAATRGMLIVLGPYALPEPMSLDPSFWLDRRVLVTGHTGFAGSWLVLWLEALGADVAGLSRGATPGGRRFAGDVGDPAEHLGEAPLELVGEAPRGEPHVQRGIDEAGGLLLVEDPPGDGHGRLAGEERAVGKRLLGVLAREVEDLRSEPLGAAGLVSVDGGHPHG
ncbi:MAG: NAD-dependent epimerase/dehydratase family protein [Solirubrobacteraceae bacterium]